MPRPSSAGKSSRRRNIGVRSPRRKKRCSAKRHSARGEIVRGGVARGFRCLAFIAVMVLAGGTAMHGEILGFDIEAHRGGRALFPENTLVSFANALSMASIRLNSTSA